MRNFFSFLIALSFLKSYYSGDCNDSLNKKCHYSHKSHNYMHKFYSFLSAFSFTTSN